MRLERSQVEHIASLARIGLTEEELETLGEPLSQLWEQSDGLNELDSSRGTLAAGAGGLQQVNRAVRG